MRFSEVLGAIRTETHDGVSRCTVDVPDNWLQGRTVFGGLQAAIALQAMRPLVPDAMPLRTLQATFFAPVPGGPVTAEGRLLRVGKSTVHAQGQLLGSDGPLCTLLCVFGRARTSTVAITPRQEPVVCAQPVEFRYRAGVTPAFTQHFAARWLRGAPPFTGSTLPEAVIALDMLDAGAASEAHVLAIADWIPPVALSLLRQPSPGSTMTWMLEFLRERCDDLSLSGWRVDAQLVAAAGGYTSQSVMLWGPGGAPVALSRQSMVVFG